MRSTLSFLILSEKQPTESSKSTSFVHFALLLNKIKLFKKFYFCDSAPPATSFVSRSSVVSMNLTESDSSNSKYELYQA